MAKLLKKKLTEDQKINLLVNEMKLSDMEKLSFRIGEEFGENPLLQGKILHGYFTSLLDSYKREDPEIRRLFWPETSYDDLDKFFQTIMEGYGYLVKKCKCIFKFGDWGELDNKKPHVTGYPCAYELHYKDYRFKESDSEWGISEGFLAVHPTFGANYTHYQLFNRLGTSSAAEKLQWDDLDDDTRMMNKYLGVLC